MATQQSGATRTVRRRAKTHRHPLEAFIPDEWMAEQYVSRKVRGGVVDAVLLDIAAEGMENAIISGPTGSAKTSLVYAFAAGFAGETKRKRIDGEMKTVNVIDDSKRRPVMYVPCNGAITPDQLFGGWVPNDDGTFKFVPGLLTLAVIHGGIIYFDEVNFMANKIAAVTHGLLDSRRTIIIKDARGAGLCSVCAYVNGGSAYTVNKSADDPMFVCGACGEENYTDTVFTAHENTFIVAAYNPGYRGTNSLNEAFLNRFSVKIEFPYLREVEEEMLYSARLIDVAFELRTSYASGEISVPVSTSMLLDFERFACNPRLGFPFAVENFLNAFPMDERQSVSNILSNNAQAIRSELEDDEEVDDDDIDLDDIIEDDDPLA